MLKIFFLLTILGVITTVVGNDLYINTTHVEDEATNRWVVRLAEESLEWLQANDHLSQLAESLGFKSLGKSPHLPESENIYVFEITEEKLTEVSSAIQKLYFGQSYSLEKLKERMEEAIDSLLQSTGDISWCAREVLKTRQKRSSLDTPTDPLYSSEWHLTNANVPDAWSHRTGEGVVIAVVDDGLNFRAPDFEAHYSSDFSWDFNGNDGDPTPYTGDVHGTEAAGVAAAISNSFCAVGVAPLATVASLRILGDGTTDSIEAGALGYKPQDIDVYSCSWGPTDDARRMEGPGTLTYNAIQNGVRSGRDGKGSIYVWAAGNGRANGDNCNYDGYANLPETIAVAAVDHLNVYSYYSEPCAALVVSAPSSGSDANWRIRTSKTESECSTSFGGTSAAAPLVAGVVALILEENPRLTWRDVQAVLIDTAVVIDTAGGQWDVNGAGYSFSHNYGFGLVDADAAVTAASDWHLLPAQKTYDSAVKSVTKGTTSSTLTFTIAAENSMIVEYAQIYLNAKANPRGKLSITLTSPSGMVSILQVPHVNDIGNAINWHYVSIAHWGELSRGDWVLTLTHPTRFTVTTAQLTILGH